MEDKQLLAIGAALFAGVLLLVLAWSLGWLSFIGPDEKPFDAAAASRATNQVVRGVAAMNNAAAASASRATTPSSSSGGGGGRPAVDVERQSDEVIAEQKKHCAAVHLRSLHAARALQRQHASENGGDVTTLLIHLETLGAIVDANDGNGPLGVMATTELCNALLEVNALPALEGLQKHKDTSVSLRATTIFEHVIPRIWSF